MIITTPKKSARRSRAASSPAQAPAQISTQQPPATSSAPASARQSATPSKPQLIQTLMSAPDGATMSGLVAATGWQPHSIRAAMTGLRKQGLTIILSKVEGITHFTTDPTKVTAK